MAGTAGTATNQSTADVFTELQNQHMMSTKRATADGTAHKDEKFSDQQQMDYLTT